MPLLFGRSFFGGRRIMGGYIRRPNGDVAPARCCALGALANAILATAVVVIAPIVGARCASSATKWQKVAVWHMNENSGAKMHDAVGNNDGVLHSVRLGRIGLKGGAYGFNGSSSFVEVPNSSALDIGTRSVRMTAHVRTSVYAHSSAGDDLIKKGYYSTSPGLFKMEIYPDGRVSCAFKGPKAYTGDIFSRSSVVTPPPSTPIYHTIRCVLDQAAKEARLLIDGVLEASRTADVGSISSPDRLVIGAYPGAGYYNGTLDEVVIEVAQP